MIGGRETSPKSAPGFTLLELLVSVTLLSLIVLLLFSAFRTATRAWEAGERAASVTSELRFTHDWLRRHLGAAVALQVQKEGVWRLQFEGAEDEVAFIVEVSPRFGPDGFYHYHVWRESSGEDSSLLSSSALVRDPAEEEESPEAEFGRSVLLDDLRELRFEYFGSDGPEAARWHARWKDKKALPRLVKVELSSRSAGEWPALVVRLNNQMERPYAGLVPGAPLAPPASPSPELESSQ